MAFGATTQDLHSENLCETSTVETVATARQRRPERIHGKQDIRLLHHAVQRKAMQSVPERTPSGTLRWSSARTPRNLRPTPQRDTVPCPNHGHARWPEAIRPQLDRTSQ